MERARTLELAESLASSLARLREDSLCHDGGRTPPSSRQPITPTPASATPEANWADAAPREDDDGASAAWALTDAFSRAGATAPGALVGELLAMAAAAGDGGAGSAEASWRASNGNATAAQWPGSHSADAAAAMRALAAELNDGDAGEGPLVRAIKTELAQSSSSKRTDEVV
jgi:hypothetical protein